MPLWGHCLVLQTLRLGLLRWLLPGQCPRRKEGPVRGGTTLRLSPLAACEVCPQFPAGRPTASEQTRCHSLFHLRSTGQVREFLEDHWLCYCGWNPSPPRTHWVLCGRQPSCCIRNGSSTEEKLPALGLLLAFPVFPWPTSQWNLRRLPVPSLCACGEQGREDFLWGSHRSDVIRKPKGAMKVQ